MERIRRNFLRIFQVRRIPSYETQLAQSRGDGIETELLYAFCLCMKHKPQIGDHVRAQCYLATPTNNINWYRDFASGNG